MVKTSKPAVEVSSSSLSLVSSYGNDTLADSDEEETEAEPLAETQEPPVPYEETTSEAEPEAQPAEPSVPEPEPSQDTCDSTDNGWHMDIDDIDAELDLALARKTVSHVTQGVWFLGEVLKSLLSLAVGIKRGERG